LKYAIEQGWITDAGLRIHRQRQSARIDYLESIGESSQGVELEDFSDPQRYAKIIADAFPEIRNELAHGTPIMWPGGYTTLALVADIINQIFAQS
jgi:hypothetical protein